MKKFFLSFLVSICWLLAQAQTTNSVTGTLTPGPELLLKGGIGFVKGGMPSPFGFNLPSPAGNVTGTITPPKNKTGLNAGIDFNYYFNRIIGASVTGDFFSNAYKKIEATSPPFTNSNISFTQKNQVNIFSGLGPIVRTRVSNRLEASAAVYGGMLWHKKNNYQADYSSSFGSTTMLKFSGTKPVSAIAVKGALRFAYDINPRIAVSAGVEYIMPFFGTKQYQTGLLHNSSAGYFVNTPNTIAGVVNGSQRAFDSSYVKTSGFYYKQGVEQTSKLKLLAFNVALKFRFGGTGTKTRVKKVKEKECCGECPVYGLAVTARDKFTREVLPNTDIAIKNTKGEIIKTGRTNSFGVYVIEKIIKEDYIVSGLLNNVALESSTVKKEELICDEVVQKEVLYADRNFIIKGKAVVCNTTTPIQGINVSLENKDAAFKKSTMTDADGNFILHMPEAGTYQLYGRKDNYFSQVEEVTASNYNRDKTLFVQLEICAEKTDCGKAIKLNNILFDLDKYVIKEAAKKELNRLVQFMKDNPSVKVELSSHTDCRASHEYNETLSQNRANASVDYIVSQGIDRSRLIGKGYGETKLLNRCADGVNCTEAEHAINRRTEMKVICPDGK